MNRIKQSLLVTFVLLLPLLAFPAKRLYYKWCGTTAATVDAMGPRYAALLGGAGRTEAFGLDLKFVPSEDELKAGEPNAQGYRLVGQPKRLNSDFTNRLKLALTEGFGAGMGNTLSSCVIRPNLSFRVWRGQESLDVLLCFSCSQYEIYFNPSGQSSGRFVTKGQMGRGRELLVRLAKEAFPRDRQIQALREVAEGSEDSGE